MHLLATHYLKVFCKNFATQCLDFLYPPYCTHCHVFLSKRTPLCSGCLGDIKPLVSTKLQITKKHSLRVFCIGRYKQPLKSMVLAKRWSNNAVSVQLGQLMWQYTNINSLQFDYIVPVPLHWTRFAQRGFNQAELMAQVISQKSGKPILHALKRTKRTAYQSDLPISQRIDNVQDVFSLNTAISLPLKDKHFLLVDDLLTTGATLKQAAKVLSRCKPKALSAVVACRAFAD